MKVYMLVAEAEDDYESRPNYLYFSLNKERIELELTKRLEENKIFAKEAEWWLKTCATPYKSPATVHAEFNSRKAAFEKEFNKPFMYVPLRRNEILSIEEAELLE